MPTVTWYADGDRAVVTDADGVKWWLAPAVNGAGTYTAVTDDGSEHRLGTDRGDVLRQIIGAAADAYLANAGGRS